MADRLAELAELRSVGRCGPGGGDRFESGVDAEGAKETADVVPDGLGAQVELGGRDDGGEVAAANVAEEPLARGIDSPNQSRRVEDVARDVDARAPARRRRRL
jgi:hypothetical protein